MKKILLFLTLILTFTTSTASQEMEPSTINGFLPGMRFVKIPEGAFQMGSNEGSNDEKPVHTVNIKSFYIMATEVTQAQWQAVMGNNPSYFKEDNLPVEHVSWNECQEFIKKLNQMDPDKNYRLPSEAEWEYACKAGTSTRFYSGNDNYHLSQIAWYEGNPSGLNSLFGLKTHYTAERRENSWGLFDMSGNVWEWCQDWYHDNYYGAPINGSAWEHPKGKERVIRGGCFCVSASYCRSSNRSIYFAGAYVGLRLVCNP